jgi:hypothetical protein
MATSEHELRKREARLTALEARLRTRARDLACREAELTVGDEDAHSSAAVSSVLDDGPGVRPRWRRHAVVQIVLGLCLMVAPLILGFSPMSSRAPTVAGGAALALVGRWYALGGDRARVWAPWLSATVATSLLATGALAARSVAAGCTDAVAGSATWIALTVALVRSGGAP